MAPRGISGLALIGISALIASVSLMIPLGPGARADATTFEFTGQVTDIFGLGSPTIDDEFSLGETVHISLTYDPDTPEDPSTVGDPVQSFFVDPLYSFSIEFVENARRFDATTGGVQVLSAINDLVAAGLTSDTVGAAVQTGIGGTITGTVDGSSVTIASLSLIDFEFGAGIPDMLSTAALPAVPFVPDEASIILSIVAGVSVTVTVRLDADGDGVLDVEDDCPD
jgi:hypothetical protein